MDYSEASLLAKRNPGSVIRRSGDNGFVVIGVNGEVISSPVGDPSLGAIRDLSSSVKEKDREIEMLNSAISNVTRESQVKLMKAQRLEQENYRLKRELETCNRSMCELKVSVDEYKAEISKLEAKLARVSEDDWLRISQREDADKKELYAEKKAYRSTLTCSCNGLKENCHFCDGRGSYVVDGFGNRV